MNTIGEWVLTCPPWLAPIVITAIVYPVWGWLWGWWS